MQIERRGEVAIWTLARPETRNAVDLETLVALRRAADAAAADPTLRAVILTGAGEVFASGADLNEMRSAPTLADAERHCEAGRQAASRIAALPIPVLAALPGPTLGIGAELAVACDLRIADPNAVLCFKHVQLGLTTGCGVLDRLVSAIGYPASVRILLTAQAVDAPEALRLGLVDAVSRPGASLAHALDWASAIARGVPHTVRVMKALLGAPSGERAGLEREQFIEAWASADHRQALDALFRARAARPPES